MVSLSKHELNGNLSLVSGSYDNSIKILGRQKVIYISHFAGQYGWVDSVVKYYNNGQLSEEATLTGHSDWILCVVTYRSNGKTHVVSGSRDKTVKIWDLMTRES